MREIAANGRLPSLAWPTLKWRKKSRVEGFFAVFSAERNYSLQPVTASAPVVAVIVILLRSLSWVNGLNELRGGFSTVYLTLRVKPSELPLFR